MEKMKIKMITQKIFPREREHQTIVVGKGKVIKIKGPMTMKDQAHIVDYTNNKS